MEARTRDTYARHTQNIDKLFPTEIWLFNIAVLVQLTQNFLWSIKTLILLTKINLKGFMANHFWIKLYIHHSQKSELLYHILQVYKIQLLSNLAICTSDMMVSYLAVYTIYLASTPKADNYDS